MRKRVLAALLALYTVLAMLPGTAFAATYMGGTTLPAGKTFTVNGKTISASSGTSVRNCSAYAGEVLGKIWKVNAVMTTYNGKYNMLKGKSAADRTVTAAHTKAFIQDAPLGSRIRVCNDSGTTANNYDNNRLGHTMVLVEKDSAAGTFTVLHAGWGGSAATEYTYSGFANYYAQKTNPYHYFFYIADYSAADPFSTENDPGTVVDSGSCGTNARWSLDSAGTLTISGTGEIDDGPPGTSACITSYPIKSAVIQNGITRIGGFSFCYCDQVTRISIPSTVKSIGFWSFCACTSLSSITIPSSVTVVEEGAFCGCDSLTSITIPSSVTVIERAAFSECEHLTNITIPSSVTVIHDGTFSGCTGLTSITIPSSIKEIERDAFNYCTSLKDVYYSGTKSQWEKITIGSDNKDLISANIHYNSAGTTPGGTTKTYALTFNPNGGLCSTASKKVTANAACGTLPTPHRTGYTFSGWYTAKSGGKKVTASTKATANATLYAHWTKAKRTYQVAFNANGGDVLLENKSVVRGSTYQALPTPTRPGYHFTGWYTKASGGVKITDKTKVNLTANQTLYAHWSTAAVKAASTKSGNWRISVPLYYNVMLYSSNVSASPAAYISEKSSAQTLVCTRMAVLSNGTTRYCTKQNGTYYWFTYTCEMDVN